MLLQRFEGGTALMASKNDFDRHWVSPINFNWLISISYLVECFLRYYAQSAQSGVSALRALHQPLSNVSAAFVVAPVWVGAKRIVEDYFDIRERAVIQLRHGRRPSNADRAKLSSFAKFGICGAVDYGEWNSEGGKLIGCPN
jgi:hypothetical protein